MKDDMKMKEFETFEDILEGCKSEDENERLWAEYCELQYRIERFIPGVYYAGHVEPLLVHQINAMNNLLFIMKKRLQKKGIKV